MRLQMEFMPSPTDKLTLLLLMVGVIGSGHALWQRQQLMSAVEGQRALIAQQQMYVQEQATYPQDNRSPEATRAMVQIAQDMNRPWEPMLDALREASGSAISINRIQPGEDGLTLQLAGRADNADSFLAYVSRLKASGDWQAIEPLSQESSEAGGVVFQLALEWRP